MRPWVKKSIESVEKSNSSVSGGGNEEETELLTPAWMLKMLPGGRGNLERRLDSAVEKGVHERDERLIGACPEKMRSEFQDSLELSAVFLRVWKDEHDSVENFMLGWSFISSIFTIGLSAMWVYGGLADEIALVLIGAVILSCVFHFNLIFFIDCRQWVSRYHPVFLILVVYICLLYTFNFRYNVGDSRVNVACNYFFLSYIIFIAFLSIGAVVVRERVPVDPWEARALAAAELMEILLLIESGSNPAIVIMGRESILVSLNTVSRCLNSYSKFSVVAENKEIREWMKERGQEWQDAISERKKLLFSPGHDAENVLRDWVENQLWALCTGNFEGLDRVKIVPVLQKSPASRILTFIQMSLVAIFPPVSLWSIKVLVPQWQVPEVFLTGSAVWCAYVLLTHLDPRIEDKVNSFFRTIDSVKMDVLGRNRDVK